MAEMGKGHDSFHGQSSIDVDGVIVRDEDGDMGLHMVAPIDPEFR